MVRSFQNTVYLRSLRRITIIFLKFVSTGKYHWIAKNVCMRITTVLLILLFIPYIDYFQVTPLFLFLVNFKAICARTEISLSFVHLTAGVGVPGSSCLPAFCGTLNSDTKLAAGLLLS